MTIQLVQSRAARLALPDGVVSLAVTSPPYWGLRAYDGAQVLTWGGDRDCRHVWGDEALQREDSGRHRLNWTTGGNPAAKTTGDEVSQGQFCQRCHAWRGALGLEPTPDLFITHLVEVFREVRRVLTGDGVCFVNLGDSYYHKESSSRESRTDIKSSHRYTPGGAFPWGKNSLTGESRVSIDVPYIKPKDLCLIPQRAALAFQADGWWVRSFMPWPKNNALPESVRDRPTTSHEYWIMLTKSKRYFWDGEAVRIGYKPESIKRLDYPKQDTGISYHQPGSKSKRTSKTRPGTENPSGRNRRTSDTWLDGLDGMIEQQTRRLAELDAMTNQAADYLAHLMDIQDGTGMLTTPDGEALALRFNTASYAGAHFATYPPKMIVPLIKAGSSERGVCPVCRAAWVRVVERETVKRKRKTPSGEYITGSGRGWNKEINENAGVIATTTGWKPSCTCQQNGATPEPIPALVIDPFVGSGTTLEVARSLGRDAIGFDLSYPYLATQARERLGLRALAEWGNGKLTASVREGLKVWDEEGGAAALESLPLFGGA